VEDGRPWRVTPDDGRPKIALIFYIRSFAGYPNPHQGRKPYRSSDETGTLAQRVTIHKPSGLAGHQW